MDAVFCLLDALRLFRGMSREEIREITFEIGMLGRHGLDIKRLHGDACPEDDVGKSICCCDWLAFLYAP